MTTPPPPPSPPTRPKPPAPAKSMWSRLGSKATTVSVPAPLPRQLGQRPIIFYAWLIAIVLVCFDEWHVNNTLPRPARLWYTTLVYAILTMASIVDPLVGIANALALGYTVVLLYQYYTDGGQFTNETTPASEKTGATG